MSMGGGWYAVKTQPRRERQVSLVLAQRSVETFLPLIKRRLGSDRSKVATEPLFPGYLFARLMLGSQSWLAARSAPGVAYFVGPPGQPLALPEGLVEDMRLRVAMSEAAAPRTFRPGDRVTIHGGVMDGLEAVFSERLSGAGRVRVLLTMIQQLVPVDLHVDRLCLA
jgi:transcriptional antiterminator RfaH